MTVNEFRRIALSMPQAVEQEHMDHPDFRVKGKIFATIAPVPKALTELTTRRGGQAPARRTRRSEEGQLGMVKLPPAQQGRFITANPGVFVPCQGAWGRRGCTYVRLGEVDRSTLRRAMLAAWRNTAPKRMVEELAPEYRDS